MTKYAGPRSKTSPSISNKTGIGNGTDGRTVVPLPEFVPLADAVPEPRLGKLAEPKLGRVRSGPADAPLIKDALVMGVLDEAFRPAPAPDRPKDKSEISGKNPFGPADVVFTKLVIDGSSSAK